MKNRHFEWSKELSSGDVALDTHISEFLRKANEFSDRKDGIDRVEVIDKMLSYLLDYSRQHFPAQEEMMGKIEYPSKSEHAAEHKDFVRKISKFYKQLLLQKNPNAPKDSDYDDRGIDGVISDTYDFIINWHDNHMLAADKRLVNYFNFEYKR